jgi:predicted O-linked N-acetylglucosamine transferase (SPINDLY family)
MATISEALAIAVQHQQAGRLDAAEQIYQRILQVEPDQPDALHFLGVLTAQLGRHQAAAANILRAIAVNPNVAPYHLNLGLVYQELWKLDEAVASYRRALQLQPEFVEVHYNLGGALTAQGRIAEAEACYRRALQLRPGYVEAHNNLGNVLRDQGSLDQAIACYRRALQLKPDFAMAHSNLLYTLHFSPGYDAQTIYEEHRRWNHQHGEPLARLIQPHANDRTPDRRLRVGYVSPDFCSHAECFFTVPLFSAHDHQSLEVFCYADVARPDDTTARLRSYADVWRNITGRTDEQIAQLVRQDKIDILVDLTMHMARNHLLVFARKPAPVQVCWLAYQGTTGLATVDYRLTDAHVDPPGLHERYYAEESIRLPDSFGCYDPLASEPAVNALPALETGCITFGSINNFCKVNADVFRLWAGVLRSVERSRLLLLAAEGSYRQDTLRLLEQEGVAPDRVTFVGKRSRAEYLRLCHRIDVGLDTFPYNGQTTSLDCFWMGVPVVTMVGKTAVGRAGLSLLTSLGLPEWIADGPQQFVRIAVELAGDLPRLGKLRATLRERMQNSPLMDAPRFARNVEAAYRMMWQRWCAK